MRKSLAAPSSATALAPPHAEGRKPNGPPAQSTKLPERARLSIHDKVDERSHADGSASRSKLETLMLSRAFAEREAKALARIAAPTTFAPGQFIQQPGEHVRHVYCIADGLACAFRVFGGGRRLIVNFLLPGDYFDLSMPAEAFWASKAITRIEGWRLDRDLLSCLLHKDSQLLQSLLDLVQDELVLAQRQASILGRLTAEERIASFLTGVSERLAYGESRSETIRLQMSRRDIADHLGLRIETVSRIFRRFSRVGILDVWRGGVRIVDVSRLLALASLD